MSYKSQYEGRKKKLLNDKKICVENRNLFKKFFDYEEYKLKRQNNLSSLDEATYKTLLSYASRFRNVNKWFKNKDWKKLTKVDIKKVYDDLEEGRIKNNKGKQHKDRRGYYNRVFRSKPFELAGKKQIAIEVMEFYKKDPKQEVKFIEEEDFRKLVEVVTKLEHKLLLWLAFDIGENINTLLILKKKHFVEQVNPETKEKEYRVNFPKEKLKRSRTSRSEITNFSETTKFLSILLKGLKEEDKLFNFGYGNAKKIMDRAVKLSKIKCIPTGDKPTWKDLRSGMACHLLKNGWTTDEVNARLGHKPSSVEIDKYVSFLALDRHVPKRKLFDSNIQKLTNELEEAKRTIKLQAQRLERIPKEIEAQAPKWVEEYGKVFLKQIDHITTRKAREIIRKKTKTS